MDVASSAISLVDASLSLLSKLKASYKEHGKHKISDGVRSIQGDLESIKEALRRGSENAEQQGILSWINNLRCIKLRIEDVMELYDLEFTGQTGGHFEGIGARVAELVDKGKRVVGPGRKICSYLKEIENLSDSAKKRADAFLPFSRGQQPCQTTRKDEEKYFCHDNEAEPVGLDASRKELVRMLSMSSATLLRVVAIASPDSELARASYENVQSKEEFTCKVWVTASSNDDDGKRLLKDMIDGLGQQKLRKRLLKDTIDRLGQQRQRGKFIRLAQILRDFLKNKRCVSSLSCPPYFILPF